MLIVPEELIKKIDDNRGEMSRGDFISFLIDSQMKQGSEDAKPAVQYATKEEVQSMQQDIKKLLKSFLDFIASYVMEIGKKPENGGFEEITSKLQELDKDSNSGSDKGRATIKWK